MSNERVIDLKGRQVIEHVHGSGEDFPSHSIHSGYPGQEPTFAKLYRNPDLCYAETQLHRCPPGDAPPLKLDTSVGALRLNREGTMQIPKAGVLTALLALVASAADVTGAWNGTFKVTMPNGQTANDSVRLVLKQDGTRVTGTAGPNASQQAPITKGTIEGNRILLEMPVPEGTYKFDLWLEGDHLKGDLIKSAGAQSMRVKMDAIRAR
jgi:hypothetical protein